MATANEQIADARAAATAAQAQAVTYAQNAQTAAMGYTQTGPVDDVVAQVIIPPPFDPSIHLGAEFQSTFDTTWVELETWLRGLMSDWLNTYFPTIDPLLGPAEDSWLLNVVNNGYSGIPPALERAIWERARGKEMIEAVRLENEAVSQFAARGFALPAGVLADRVLQIQQDAANKSATIARELAIKQIEIAVDMAKLAITEITKLRLGIAQALADYIRAWMAIPQAAADIAKAKAQMNQILWQSSADYIRAQVSIAQLDLDAQKMNVATNVELQKTSMSSFDAGLGRRVQAALGAATVMGNSAAASLGAQNTLVGEIASAKK